MSDYRVWCKFEPNASKLLGRNGRWRVMMVLESHSRDLIIADTDAIGVLCKRRPKAGSFISIRGELGI